MDNISLDFKKAFPLPIVFEICKRLCRVLGCVFKPTGSIASRLPSPLYGGLDELAGALTLPPRPLNLPLVATVSARAPLIVYINKKVQDIIPTILKARRMVTEGP